MSDAGLDDPQVKMLVLLSRIDERQETFAREQLTIKEQLASFVSESDLARVISPLQDRIKTLESTQAWLMRSVVGASIAAVTGIYAWGKQKLGN
jgi:hypothetical protein